MIGASGGGLRPLRLSHGLQLGARFSTEWTSKAESSPYLRTWAATASRASAFEYEVLDLHLVEAEGLVAPDTPLTPTFKSARRRRSSITSRMSAHRHGFHMETPLTMDRTTPPGRPSGFDLASPDRALRGVVRRVAAQSHPQGRAPSTSGSQTGCRWADHSYRLAALSQTPGSRQPGSEAPRSWCTTPGRAGPGAIRNPTGVARCHSRHREELPPGRRLALTGALVCWRGRLLLLARHCWQWYRL
jgi:hypothetical protein